MTLEKVIEQAFGTPTPKQDQFLKAATRYVGYGGARGGGKSFSVRLKATLLAFEFPRIKMLVIRESFPELRRNYVRPMQEIFASFPDYIKPSYSDSEKCFHFPNGSIIELGYCSTDADVAGYIGNEWDVLFLDEATQLTEYQYGALNSCIRGVNKHPKRTYCTCNPGGVGHGNIKRLFIDRDYRRGERTKDYTFIQARVWDNLPLLESDQGFNDAVRDLKRKLKIQKLTEEHIKECMYASDYVRTLDNLPKDLREAWLNGDWNVFSGQYFGEFDERVHVVEPFSIPDYWRKSVAIDYGLDMLAILWFAVDEHGKVYCYRSFERSNIVVSLAAKIVKELSQGEYVREFIAPPDLWNRNRDTGISTAETFAISGVPLIKAGNDRIQGWLQVKEYLKYETNEGKVTKPPKMVFFDNCTNVIKNLPLLQYDTKKINDVCTEPHELTHITDALRYWCSRWQMGTEVKEKEKKYPFECLKPKPDGMEVTESYLYGGYDGNM